MSELPTPLFHIVLIEPEIPPNTGTIGRLCLALGLKLHLVKPLGFDLSEKALRRAGLDYWKHLDVTVHEGTNDFFSSLPTSARVHLIETGSEKTHYEIPFQAGDYLIFGRETTGIPYPIREKFNDHIYTMPMRDSRARSINLSNCVSVVAYEGFRKLSGLG